MEHLAMEHQEKQVGPYTLVSKIGDGGMAEVFMARMQGAGSFEKTIALKKILPNLASNPKFRGNFINEARICGLLHHHNIVQVYNFYQDGQDLYLAMEYIDGISLDAIFKYCRESGTVLTTDLVVSIMLQVLEGLNYAHTARNAETHQPLEVIHRDLKPSNILIDSAGVVKIVDFGVAKAANRQYETMEMTAKGTASYMAPEQILGEQPVSQRSDLFAVGAILYELITLERLFDGETVWAILKQVATMDIDRHLEDAISGAERKYLPILRKSLARDPADRYPHASDIHKDLVALRTASASARALADLLRKIRNLDEELEDAATRLVTVSELKASPEPAMAPSLSPEHPLDEDDDEGAAGETVLSAASMEQLLAQAPARGQAEITGPTHASESLLADAATLQGKIPASFARAESVLPRQVPAARGIDMPSIAAASSPLPGVSRAGGAPGASAASTGATGAQGGGGPAGNSSASQAAATALSSNAGSGTGLAGAAGGPGGSSGKVIRSTTPAPPAEGVNKQQVTIPGSSEALSPSSTLPSLFIGAAVGGIIVFIIFLLTANS